MLFAHFTPMPQEICIDVPKAAVERLLAISRSHCDKAYEDNAMWAQVYWDGYCRALEHVIEMEGE